MRAVYNKEIDKLKGIGIILMIIGHAGAKFSNVIYLFHMPLFYFLAGYVFKYNHIYEIKKFILKKLRGYYIPFIKFSMMFILLHNFFVKIKFYNPNLAYDSITFRTNFIKNILFINTEELLGGMWFLTSIFITNIIYVVISKVSKNKEKIYINSIVIIIFILNITIFARSIDFDTPILNYYFLMFRISCSGIVFFHIGYLCSKNNIVSKIKGNVCYLVISIIYLKISTNYGVISMGSNEYGSSPTFFIGNAILGIYVIYCISNYIKHAKIEQVLIFIGKNTIGILALHMIAFKLVNYLQIKTYNYPIEYLSAFPYIDGSNGWWIIYTIVGILIPIMYILVEKKIIILSKKIMKMRRY